MIAKHSAVSERRVCETESGKGLRYGFVNEIPVDMSEPRRAIERVMSPRPTARCPKASRSPSARLSADDAASHGNDVRLTEMTVVSIVSAAWDHSPDRVSHGEAPVNVPSGRNSIVVVPAGL